MGITTCLGLLLLLDRVDVITSTEAYCTVGWRLWYFLSPEAQSQSRLRYTIPPTPNTVHTVVCMNPFHPLESNVLSVTPVDPFT
jgi:hypothetical protein